MKRREVLKGTCAAVVAGLGLPVFADSHILLDDPVWSKFDPTQPQGGHLTFPGFDEKELAIAEEICRKDFHTIVPPQYRGMVDFMARTSWHTKNDPLGQTGYAEWKYFPKSPPSLDDRFRQWGASKDLSGFDPDVQIGASFPYGPHTNRTKAEAESASYANTVKRVPPEYRGMVARIHFEPVKPSKHDPMGYPGTFGWKYTPKNIEALLQRKYT